MTPMLFPSTSFFPRLSGSTTNMEPEPPNPNPESNLPLCLQGCWGYLMAVDEIQKQSEDLGFKFDDIIMVSEVVGAALH
jgi:hypothetical protein